MRKIIGYLQLNEIGFLEVLFALFPILLGYSYFGLPGDVVILLLLDVIALFKRKKFFCPTILTILFGYILLHELIIYLLYTDGPQYMLNAMISTLVVFISIPILASAINPQKLAGSFNLVAIICIIGIIYHFLVVSSGGVVNTIRIPFLSASEDSRFFQDSYRPLSFFWEPQSYCSFMLVPLYLSLLNKRYLWTIVIVLSMFLSTSTTGIILAPIVLLTYAFVQNSSKRVKVAFVILTVAIAYSLFSLSIFEQGVEKLENVDASTNVRLTSGIEYISHLKSEDLIFGIPSPNPTVYWRSGGVLGADLIEGRDSQAVFIPTFWLVIIKFGVIGIFLYLMAFFYPVKREKSTIIYVVPLFVSMFSNPDYINSAFALEIIVLYSQIRPKCLSKRKVLETQSINTQPKADIL